VSDERPRCFANPEDELVHETDREQDRGEATNSRAGACHRSTFCRLESSIASDPRKTSSADVRSRMQGFFESRIETSNGTRASARIRPRDASSSLAACCRPPRVPGPPTTRSRTRLGPTMQVHVCGPVAAPSFVVVSVRRAPFREQLRSSAPSRRTPGSQGRTLRLSNDV